MKITALLALTFVVLLSPILAQENVTEPLSANDAFKLGMEMYYEFMNETGGKYPQVARFILKVRCIPAVFSMVACITLVVRY